MSTYTEALQQLALERLNMKPPVVTPQQLEHELKNPESKLRKEINTILLYHACMTEISKLSQQQEYLSRQLAVAGLNFELIEGQYRDRSSLNVDVPPQSREPNALQDALQEIDREIAKTVKELNKNYKEMEKVKNKVENAQVKHAKNLEKADKAFKNEFIKMVSSGKGIDYNKLQKLAEKHGVELTPELQKLIEDIYISFMSSIGKPIPITSNGITIIDENRIIAKLESDLVNGTLDSERKWTKQQVRDAMEKGELNHIIGQRIKEYKEETAKAQEAQVAANTNGAEAAIDNIGDMLKYYMKLKQENPKFAMLFAPLFERLDHMHKKSSNELNQTEQQAHMTLQELEATIEALGKQVIDCGAKRNNILPLLLAMEHAITPEEDRRSEYRPRSP